MVLQKIIGVLTQIILLHAVHAVVILGAVADNVVLLGVLGQLAVLGDLGIGNPDHLELTIGAALRADLGPVDQHIVVLLVVLDAEDLLHVHGLGRAVGVVLEHLQGQGALLLVVVGLGLR